MLYVFAVELLIMDGLRLLEKPSPVRISSIPKGAQVRPGIYSLIEDVVSPNILAPLSELILCRLLSMEAAVQHIEKP